MQVWPLKLQSMSRNVYANSLGREGKSSKSVKDDANTATAIIITRSSLTNRASNLAVLLRWNWPTTILTFHVSPFLTPTNNQGSRKHEDQTFSLEVFPMPGTCRLLCQSGLRNHH